MMEAEYTEDIGHLFGEKVRRPPPPPPRRPPPKIAAQRAVDDGLRLDRPGANSRHSVLSQPLPEGVKRVKQSWETPYVVTMVTAAVMVTIGLNFKPETGINAWAKEEALRRKAVGEI